MEFEWDEKKSRENKRNHGLSFDQVRQIILAGGYSEIPARSETEPRTALVCTYEKKVWTAIITRRDGKIRIISCRRAWPKEKKYHEQD